VSSGNNSSTCPIAVNQANSIKKFDETIAIEHFRIKGKGFFGYLKNINGLRKMIREFKPDIVHSHYSFSGYLTVLSKTKIPIIASLMGSDVQVKGLWKQVLLHWSKHWNIIIVKSDEMKKKCSIERSVVIPNGVDFSSFNFIEKEVAKKKLNLSAHKKYVLFLSNPNRPEKNFTLAKQAFDLIKDDDKELLVAYNIPFEQTADYYYASDVILMTSRYEGSPNVIKEAMACNKAIVSANVGDVSLLLKGIDGCFITSNDPKEISLSISKALAYENPTKGRERLLELGIDSASIAKNIIQIYNRIINAPITQVHNSVYKICEKGIWDETIPEIRFDAEGVSNYCRLQEKMMKDHPRGEVGRRSWEDFVIKIKQAGKKNTYDCIIGVSGGVDSSYLLHICKDYGLRPLAVHLDNGFNSEIAVNNIHKVISALNIDLKTHVINYEEIKDLFRSYMKASLPWIDAPTDLAIKATMYKIAHQEGIKYIIRGNDFRSEGKQPTEWTYSDSRQLKYIHKKFGSGVKLKTYPLQSFFKMVYAGLI
ncbi:MAG: glycosyltransferase, partial [Bacteroidota bacterium]